MAAERGSENGRWRAGRQERRRRIAAVGSRWADPGLPSKSKRIVCNSNLSSATGGRKEGPLARAFKQGGDDLRLELDPELPIDRRIVPVVELDRIVPLDPLDGETGIRVDQGKPIGRAALGDGITGLHLGREVVAEIRAVKNPTRVVGGGRREAKALSPTVTSRVMQSRTEDRDLPLRPLMLNPGKVDVPSRHHPMTRLLPFGNIFPSKRVGK